MGKRLGNVLLGLVFVGGVALFSYPTVSNWLNDRYSNSVIGNYRESVDNLSDEEIEKKKEAAKAYNETLTNDREFIPYGDEEESTLDILDVGEILGYIEIPKIDVSLPIYEGTSEAVLQKGVGHLKNTSLPIGGKGTHAALSAHRGLPSAKLFTDLDKLEEGDYFYLHVLDETLAYEVDQILIIEPYISHELDIDKEEDYVTLITCTPYGINSHRMLVRGTRVPYAEKTADELDEVYQVEPEVNWYIVVCVLSCLTEVILISILVRRLVIIRKRT